MKKYLIGGVVAAAFIAYAIFASDNNAPPIAATSPTGTTPGVPNSNGPTSTTPITTPPSGNPPGTPPITVGATGTQVVALQSFLITNNYLTVVSKPTGYFGTYTRAALIEFQTANGVTPASGELDNATLALINNGASSGGTTTSASTGQYTDGTYTGAVADAFYGKLQVTITVKGGAITNVTFPQAPSGGHSSDVSAVALPQLAQEAIAAQSANVNVVSGATQDSQAFQQSLASALAQAKS
jgi:uncharacterized protein with FMN-binding domain